MGKLITPLHFEPAIDGLNIVKPINLADEIKQELSLPVANRNPASINRPVDGKLLQSDNQGAGLFRNSGGYDNVESITQDFTHTMYYGSVTFSQIIKHLTVRYTFNQPTFQLRLTDSDHMWAWYTVVEGETNDIPFRGEKVWFQLAWMGANFCDIYWNGFY